MLKTHNELKKLIHRVFFRKKKKKRGIPLPFLFQFTLRIDHSANKLNMKQKQIIFPPSPKQLLCSQGLQGKGIYVISPANTAVQTRTGFWTCKMFVLYESWKDCVNSLLPSAFAKRCEFPVLITHKCYDPFSVLM